MAEANVFVHPQYHSLWHPDAASPELARYEADLEAKIADACLPILLQDQRHLGQGTLWPLFEENHIFTTNEESGTLPLPEAVRLNCLLAEQDVVKAVVHGAYYRFCVMTFAQSLRKREGRLAYAPGVYLEERIIKPVRIGSVLAKYKNNEDKVEPCRPFAPDAAIYFAEA